MRDSNLDLFDHKKTFMGSTYSSEVGRSDDDFSFAFNDSNFSDRVLCIEIVSEPVEVKPDGEGSLSVADLARNRKRRRQDIKRDNAVDIAGGFQEEQILDLCEIIANEFVYKEYKDQEAASMIEKSQPDEAANDNDSIGNMDYSSVVRVKSIHISSPILAAKSPFFYKLFSNGMKESEQRRVNLRINASEEAALMELLKFMYSNRLTATSAPALLDVLIAADKFEDASCVRHCVSLLTNLPMTPESAVLFLDLPSSVLLAEAVQPLIDAAKAFLAARYKDITKFEDEILNLPLVGVEVILSSDDLQVASEDAIYDFVLKWARIHYPKIKERREIIKTRLSQYIRFPYMTCKKLKKVTTSNEFDHKFAQNLVLEALFFKAEPPRKNPNLKILRFTERAYKHPPVQVGKFGMPRHQCVVYLDLKREECANLFPSGRVYSQAFRLGGQRFSLSAHCNMDQQSSLHSFGLSLGMQGKGSVPFAVDYEFWARLKPVEDFVSKHKGNYTFTGGKAVGNRNLFAIPWTSFIEEESTYFINGVLHLRAELTIRN